MPTRTELERERYASDPEYRARRKAISKASYDKHAEARREAARERRRLERKTSSSQFFVQLWTRYRLRPEDWHALVIAQSGRCAICNDPMTDPQVDHCHTAGHNRGLLCGFCNRGLGMFKDDPERLLHAAAYLM